MEYVYVGNNPICMKCGHRKVLECTKHSPVNCKNIVTCPAKKFDWLKDDNLFPILMPYSHKEYGKVSYFVPFAMVKEYESQCLENHGQSAQRLRERGGLTWDELYCVLKGLSLHHCKGVDTKKKEIFDLVSKWVNANVTYDSTEEKPKEYVVPVSWAMCGFINIKADSPQAAMKLAKEYLDYIRIHQSNDENYIDGSFGFEGDEEQMVDMIEMYTESYEKGQHFDFLEVGKVGG